MKTYKRYFLTQYTNPEFNEGFYVVAVEGKRYMLGHLNKDKTKQHAQISHEIYRLLKKQSIKAERLVKKAVKEHIRKGSMLIGQHGLGKSVFVKKMAKKAGMKVINFKMSKGPKASDILGLPTLKKGK